jgi:hypothetical protein
MHVWKGGLKGYISVCNSGILSYLCVYVRVQNSLCVFVSGAGLLYENRGPLSARLFRAPVFLRPNSGSTPAPVRHSDRAQILRDKNAYHIFGREWELWGSGRIAYYIFGRDGNYGGLAELPARNLIHSWPIATYATTCVHLLPRTYLLRK